MYYKKDVCNIHDGLRHPSCMEIPSSIVCLSKETYAAIPAKTAFHFPLEKKMKLYVFMING